MLFGATLKTNNPIFRNWRAQSLMTGHLEGVPFRYTGVQYVVDQIPGDKVNALLAHNNVRVHMIAVLPDPEPVRDESEKDIQITDTPIAHKPRGRPPLSRK